MCLFGLSDFRILLIFSICVGCSDVIWMVFVGVMFVNLIMLCIVVLIDSVLFVSLLDVVWIMLLCICIFLLYNV